MKIFDSLKSTSFDPKVLIEQGEMIGKLYTNSGLPIDMALARLSLNKSDKAIVLFGAQSWFIQHKRNSGATDKAITRQQKVNREVMMRFLKTGEVGVY